MSEDAKALIASFKDLDEAYKQEGDEIALILNDASTLLGILISCFDNIDNVRKIRDKTRDWIHDKLAILDNIIEQIDMLELTKEDSDASSKDVDLLKERLEEVVKSFENIKSTLVSMNTDMAEILNMQRPIKLCMIAFNDKSLMIANVEDEDDVNFNSILDVTSTKALCMKAYTAVKVFLDVNVSAGKKSLFNSLETELTDLSNDIKRNQEIPNVPFPRPSQPKIDTYMTSPPVIVTSSSNRMVPNSAGHNVYLDAVQDTVSKPMIERQTEEENPFHAVPNEDNRRKSAPADYGRRKNVGALAQVDIQEEEEYDDEEEAVEVARRNQEAQRKGDLLRGNTQTTYDVDGSESENNGIKSMNEESSITSNSKKGKRKKSDDEDDYLDETEVVSTENTINGNRNGKKHKRSKQSNDSLQNSSHGNNDNDNDNNVSHGTIDLT